MLSVGIRKIHVLAPNTKGISDLLSGGSLGFP